MNNNVIIALIVTIGAIICLSLYIYFSPYQTCKRDLKEQNKRLGLDYSMLLCSKDGRSK